MAGNALCLILWGSIQKKSDRTFYVRFLLESIWEENFLMNTAVQNY